MIRKYFQNSKIKSGEIYTATSSKDDSSETTQLNKLCVSMPLTVNKILSIVIKTTLTMLHFRLTRNKHNVHKICTEINTEEVSSPTVTVYWSSCMPQYADVVTQHIQSIILIISFADHTSKPRTAGQALIWHKAEIFTLLTHLLEVNLQGTTNSGIEISLPCISCRTITVLNTCPAR
jgi:hypothetical protein